MRSPLLALFPAAIVALASEAQAAETGNLRGRVLDANDLPVPGATVTVSGAGLAGTRQAQTDAEGRFQILSLPPGRHTLTVDRPGFARAQLQVLVRLDETAFVPITLTNSATPDEVMVVEEELPVIDTTRTAVSVELRDTQLQNLPVGRSYQDAVQMIPGVSGRVDTSVGGPGDGNPSVRGEGQYGNNYLVDGISTRDPATKTFGSNVNFDAIESIQVYTDGAPAEFSQATGMVVNVATKEGGDEHHGSAGYWVTSPAAWGEYAILNLDTGEEEQQEKRSFLEQEISVTAGGPIVKERLWYFSALDLGLDRVQYETMDPDAPYRQRSIGGFGKLTFFATPDVSIQYLFNGQDTYIENYQTDLYTAEAESNYSSRDLGHIATLRWRPGSSNELEVKASYLPSHVDEVPASGDEDVPSYLNVDTGEYSNNYQSFDYNIRSRAGASAKFTQMVSGFLGSHTFKAGAEYWLLRDSRELIYTGPGEGVTYFVSPGSGNPCPEESGLDADCVGYQEFSDAGALGHQGNIFGLFIQDDWSPIDPVTLNLGVRVDRETLYQNAGEQIIDQWMPAPRLGLAWDVTNDSKTLFSVNAGRYYDISGNTFAEWGDTRSAAVYRQYEYNPDSGEYELIYEQDPESNPLVYCTDQSLDSYENVLVNDYGFAAEDAAAERKIAEGYCDGTLRPYHMDKLVVGLEREVVPLLAIGVKGIWSKTSDIPEDIDINDMTWVIANTEAKYRDYRALELTLERKYDERWQAMASYTLSASRGHMPGEFELSSGGQYGSSGNEVGVYLDDINDPGTRADYYAAGYGSYVDGLYGLGTVTDDQGYFGYLPYHSFHQAKLSGFYSFTFGTTLGLVYEFDSGHAWQKRGYVDLYQDYYAFPEGRGTRFMPPVHYIDMRIAHKVEFERGRSIEASVDVFNLPDFETPITYYENDNESFGKVLYRQAPRSVRGGIRVTY